MGTDQVGTGLPWVEAIALTFPAISFGGFHRQELPALVAQRGALVADDVRGAAPLAFTIEDGTTFTWCATDQGVEAVEADAGATLVELSARTFSEHLQELVSASGAVRTGRARVVRGELTGWQRWEPAIQSLLTGRPIYGDAV